MSTLQVANLAFESTDNNQIVYVSNTVNVTIGGANDVMSSNSSTVTLKFASIVSNNFAVSATTFDFATNAAIKTLNTNGSLIFSGNVSPTQLTVNTASWNPGIGNSYLVRMSSSGAVTLYGLVAGSNGQVVVLNNIGSSDITLNAEDAANESTAANRFQLPNNVTLYPFSSISLIYDSIAQRWRTQNSLGTPYIHKTQLTKGFFSGGRSPAVVTADRTTYSTEVTAAVPGANLSQARNGLAGAGNMCKGFFSGGSPTLVTADRTTYSTETTVAVPGANLSQARRFLAGAGNACKGFFRGGGTTSPTTVTTADRTTYAVETTAAIASAALTQSRSCLAAAGNSCKHFTVGGYTTTEVATACRVFHSTETSAAVPVVNLSLARYVLAGAGNSDKVFFSGGFSTPALRATADRILYSTETTATVSGANLSQARCGLAAAGNECKGFFSGGCGLATADRTTYSTETTAAVPGANLSQTRNLLAAI